MLGKECFACNIPSQTAPTDGVLLLACKTSYYLLQHFKELFKFFPCNIFPTNAPLAKMPLRNGRNFHSREDPNLIWKGPFIFVVSFSFDNSMWVVVDDQDFGRCFYSGHFAISDRRPDKSCHLVSL
jgi:hypothetical protein